MIPKLGRCVVQTDSGTLYHLRTTRRVPSFCAACIADVETAPFGAGFAECTEVSREVVGVAGGTLSTVKW